MFGFSIERVKRVEFRKFFPFMLLTALCIIFTITNKRFFQLSNFMIIAQQMVQLPDRKSVV